MLTNEDINILKAVIYASRRVSEVTYDATMFSHKMDEEIKRYLEAVQPSRLIR